MGKSFQSWTCFLQLSSLHKCMSFIVFYCCKAVDLICSPPDIYCWSCLLPVCGCMWWRDYVHISINQVKQATAWQKGSIYLNGTLELALTECACMCACASLLTCAYVWTFLSIRRHTCMFIDVYEYWSFAMIILVCRLIGLRLKTNLFVRCTSYLNDSEQCTTVDMIE